EKANGAGLWASAGQLGQAICVFYHSSLLHTLGRQGGRPLSRPIETVARRRRDILRFAWDSFSSSFIGGEFCCRRWRLCISFVVGRTLIGSLLFYFWDGLGHRFTLSRKSFPMLGCCAARFRCFPGDEGFMNWSAQFWTILLRGIMKSWDCCIWMMVILRRRGDVMTGRFRNGRIRWIRFIGGEWRKWNWVTSQRRYRIWSER